MLATGGFSMAARAEVFSETITSMELALNAIEQVGRDASEVLSYLKGLLGSLDRTILNFRTSKNDHHYVFLGQK